MNKKLLLRLAMKLDPASMRKMLVGRPTIDLFNKMTPLAKARLAAGRKLLEMESSAYRSLIDKGLSEGLRDKTLLGVAAGSALGAGSLGWSLAKENPEGKSRLAELLTQLLFMPVEVDRKREEPVDTLEWEAPRQSNNSLSDLYNMAEIIDWGAE